MKISENDKNTIKKACEAMAEYSEKYPEMIKIGMYLVFEDAQKAIRDHFDNLPEDKRIKLICQLKEIEYDLDKSQCE